MNLHGGPIKILMLPKAQNVRVNPYTAMLSDGLEEIGATVRPGDSIEALLSKADVVHVHWPHNFASGGQILKALFRSMALLLLIWWQRLLGAKIVWTVHDIHSFDRRHPRLETLLMAIFKRHTSGLIFPSLSSRTALGSVWPRGLNLPFRVIPIGLYGSSFPACVSRKEARQILDLNLEGPVIAFVGDIKPYKNIEALFRAFLSAKSRFSLVVAGASDPDRYEHDVEMYEAEIKVAGLPYVRIRRRLTDDELALVVDAADFIALPYKITWNSGMGIMCLERERPLICADAAVFHELRAELGETWLHISNGRFSSTVIKNAEAYIGAAKDKGRLEQFLSLREWGPVARETLKFYIDLCMDRRVR